MKIRVIIYFFVIVINFSLTAQTDKEDYEKAKSYFEKGNVFKQKFKLDSAELYFQNASELFLKHNYITGYIQSKYSVADILIQRNKYKQAETIINEIEKMTLDNYGENFSFLTFIYYGKGIINASKGKQDSAIVYYLKAYTIDSKSEKPNEFHQSNIYAGLGNAYTEKGMPDNALQYYEKDLSIKKKILGENHPMTAVALNNIANLYRSKGQYDKALEYIEKALNLSLNAYGKNNYETAKYYAVKGSIYQDKNQNDLALEFYKTALNIDKAVFGERHKAIADILNSIGIIYNKLEDYDKALIYFKDAYDMQIDLLGEDHPDLAGTSNNIANILRVQNKYESSIKYYEKAVAIKIKYFGTNHPELAVFYNNMGINYFSIKNYPSALQYYLKAVEIIQSNYGENYPGVISMYLNIGDIYRTLNQYDKSLSYYQKSISANIKSFKPDTTDLYTNPKIETCYDIIKLLNSLEGKARALDELYLEQQDKKIIEASYDTYILCDSVISIARSTVEKKADKITLGNSTKNIYENAVILAKTLSDITFDKNKSEEYIKKAFYFAENNKAVVLSEAVSASEAEYFIELPEDLRNKEKSLKISISDIEKELAEEIDNQKIRLLEDSLFEMNDQLRKLNNHIEAVYPKYHKLKYKPLSFSVDEIQKYLDEETAVRSFFMGEDVFIFFTITKHSITLSSNDIPIDLRSKVVDFNRYITSGYQTDFKNYADAAYGFYSMLFPDAIPVQVRNLIIIPDGILGILPFESFLTEKYQGNYSDFKNFPFLIKKYKVNYAYSAGLLLKTLGNSTNGKPDTWLGIAPVFENLTERMINNVNVTELPGTRTEIQNIENILQMNNFVTKSVFDKAANESFIKSIDLIQYKYIHIATHGIVNTDEPQLSGLFFYPESQTKNSVLFSGEIYNLKMNADLVVLSACETGLGQVSKSEGIIGLSRALLYAGAKNIIVSLWKVSDESTTQLMTDFYNNLISFNFDKTKSLHEAKLKMIARGDAFSHPFFWSPFILIGK
jgi:CHAT domain-containing protein/Tfp pilus assembly protein PilF